jgi:hypothetical protein
LQIERNESLDMLSPEHARNDPLTTYRGPPASDRFRLFGRQCREYAGLLRVAEGLTFEPHRIDYDRTGRYNPLTNIEFPFCIRLFNYRHNDFTAALTWHEHLELWIPIDSEVSFRMAERRVDLDAGEILIVDNLKLHTVLDQPGLDARVISIGFLPEFVYSLGSPSYDYYALLPFFTHQTGSPHLVQIHPSSEDLVGFRFPKINVRRKPKTLKTALFQPGRVLWHLG